MRVSTDLIEIDQENPSQEAIARAAGVIRKGGVVAIPTDALYMLVADPYNLHAVGQVFKAKKREVHRSLPLLIDDMVMAEELATEVTKRFTLLARHFWPGPLTIIVPASAKVPLKVTGNTGRLALRQAKAKAARQLIEMLGQPLISTSANLSGQPTCAFGIEVFGQMDGNVHLVLDGGPCVGVPGTTLDITEPIWKVIKEGAITEKEIAECLRGA